MLQNQNLIQKLFKKQIMEHRKLSARRFSTIELILRLHNGTFFYTHLHDVTFASKWTERAVSTLIQLNKTKFCYLHACLDNAMPAFVQNMSI